MSKNLNFKSSVTLIAKEGTSPIERARQFTKALALLAVAVLVVGGSGIFLLSTRIQNANKEAARREAEAGSSQQIASRYQTTLDTYDETAGQLQFLEASVTQKEFVPTLLQQLQGLGESTQLTVTSVRPGPIVSATPTPPATPRLEGGSDSAPAKKAAPLPYDIQPIAISATGTYPQLMRFVYSLPRFPKILSLQSVTLHPGAADKTDGVKAAKDATSITADIVLNAYVFNADAAPGPDAPKMGSISDLRRSQDDVVTQAAGRAIGTARSDAQTENARNAQTPIAAPVVGGGRL